MLRKLLFSFWGIILVSVWPIDASAQNHNFIRTWSPHKSVVDETSISGLQSPAEVSTVTQYYDGLGRPIQMVSKRQSPQGKDLVNIQVYDSLGRETQRYLPFVSNAAQSGDITNDGNYKNDALQQQESFNQSQFPNEANFFYSKTTFENSPLNRPLNAYAPGKNWVGSQRGATVKQWINTEADSVRIWEIAQAQGSLPTTTGTYAAGKLYKTVSVDENGIQMVTFKNIEGQVVLEKKQLTAAADNGNGSGHSGWLCTYDVYDDDGNLRFIITPKAVQAINGTWILPQGMVNGLCFRYEYDGKGRMIVKKVPGAGEVQMVYDLRDRLVFSQTGNQRDKHQWIITYYDIVDRVIETGLYTNPGVTRQSLQEIMDTISTSPVQIDAPSDLIVNNRSGGTPPSYVARNSITFNPGFESDNDDNFIAYIDPNATKPNPNGELTNNPRPLIDPLLITPLTYTYYDDYDWNEHQPFQGSYLSKVTGADNLYSESPSTYSTKTRGTVTGTKVKVLGGTPDQWLITTTYYDDEGRQLQMLASNISGGTDVVTNKYNFSGKLLSSYVVNHNNNSSLTPEIRILTENKYDANGRLLTITKTINDEPTTRRIISANSYDELGNLETKTLGNDLETLKYDFNIRGWLTGINKNYTTSSNTNNYFGMELGYDKSTTTSGTTNFTPNYTGNISGEIWKSKGDNVPRKYDFTYDHANRLKAARFIQNTSGVIWNHSAVDFSVSNLTYDPNGNIMSMRQYGLKGSTSSPIDELLYTYQVNSNRLLKVTDTVSDPNTTLGDFHDGTNTNNDYAYDTDGNLISDANKKINSITYNYLNLPKVITVSGKGKIEYIYDAVGNKLQKIVTDQTVTPSRIATTSYINGFIYKYEGNTIHDTLSFFPTEEGRIRFIPPSESTAASYVYDYFISDHLGNVRMVLTEQTDFSHYLATMEQQNTQKENLLFYNINTTRATKPIDYPHDNTTNSNTAVSRLNGDDPDRRIGPSIILKVMAGDTIQAAIKAFYRQQVTKKNNAGLPAKDILERLLQTLIIRTMPATILHDGSMMTNSRLVGPVLNVNNLQQLKERSSTTIMEDKPKAYLNYIFFDNQLKFVDGGSGVKQVSGNPGELETLNSGKVVAKKDGYVYIYTSNESQQDVFFDNLVVLDISGPILEEAHYYPDGLVMTGISSTAPLKLINRFRYQGKELQTNEFSDSTGLEWYDFSARYYDPQIGRWWTEDPAGQFSSPYLAMANNWTAISDPDGEFAWFIPIIFGALANTIMHAPDIHNMWQALGYAAIGGAAGALGEGVANTVAGGAFFGEAAEQTVSLGVGAASGAAGGFASEFANAAGNSWISGANFREGLLAGINSGMKGAVIGGLTNAIGSGVRKLAMKQAGEVEISDEYLNKAQRIWYPEAPMDKVRNFTVENPSLEAMLYFRTHPSYGAVTLPELINAKLTGYSSVYFNKLVAFKDAKTLYYMMGHELVHVSQISTLINQGMEQLGTNLHSITEWFGYSYERFLGRSVPASFLQGNELRRLVTENPGLFKQMDFLNFEWIFHAKYRYIWP